MSFLNNRFQKYDYYKPVWKPSVVKGENKSLHKQVKEKKIHT